MNQVDRDKCRDTILDSIEALRKNVPEVFFNINVIPVFDGDYHVEVVAIKKFLRHGHEYRHIARDLYTHDWGKFATTRRIFGMAKELKILHIDTLLEDYLNELNNI